MNDYMLANYCAPTFLGLKASNMVSIRNCQSKCFEQCEGCMEEYNFYFKESGYAMHLLRNKPNSKLVLVCNEKHLAHMLSKWERRDFLSSVGYRKIGSAYCVEMLKERMRGREFPHEVGIFLDYPMGDILGYIEHGGKNCQVSGYWKVYSDAEGAMKKFQKYSGARCYLLSEIAKGKNMIEIHKEGLF